MDTREELRKAVADWEHDTEPVVDRVSDAGVKFYKHVCTKTCRRCKVESLLAAQQPAQPNVLAIGDEVNQCLQGTGTLAVKLRDWLHDTGFSEDAFIGVGDIQQLANSIQNWADQEIRDVVEYDRDKLWCDVLFNANAGELEAKVFTTPEGGKRIMENLIEAANATPPVQGAGTGTLRKDETGWVIVKRDVLPMQYVCAWSGGLEFTTDNLKAIRFCRREDANQIAEILDSEDVLIQDHMWCYPSSYAGQGR